MRPRKLGLLGGTFEDNSFTIFVIPDPSDVVSQGSDVSTPICGSFRDFACFQSQPLILFQWNCPTQFFELSWKKLHAGRSTGRIVT